MILPKALVESSLEKGTWKGKHVRLIKNTYASPAGTSIKIAQLIKHCMSSPARGAPKGLLLARTDANGIMPSRPSSCMTETKGVIRMLAKRYRKMRWK